MSNENFADDKWWLWGESNGWKMPPTSWWQRLPILRHLRAAYYCFRVEWHYRNCFGRIETGYDDWVLHGMWRGFK